MGKPISVKNLSNTLKIVEYNDGFWLWDETQKMNLALRAKTDTEALVKAITYYQNRLCKIEQDYKNLSIKVDSFISQFVDEEE